MIEIALNAFLDFSRKGFQIRHSKISKKLRNALFKRLQHWLLRSRYEKHFLWYFLRPNFHSSSLERFPSLCQEVISLWSLKNLSKSERRSFQADKTFVLELKVPPKPFSKKLLFSKFWFKQFWTLCFTFPESDFNLVMQKLAKNCKMPFPRAHNICFWGQGSFKDIFYEGFYDQIFIQIVLNALTDFPRKWFHFRHWKIKKKQKKPLKNALFKCSQHWFLSSR